MSLILPNGKPSNTLKIGDILYDKNGKHIYIVEKIFTDENNRKIVRIVKRERFTKIFVHYNELFIDYCSWDVFDKIVCKIQDNNIICRNKK